MRRGPPRARACAGAPTAGRLRRDAARRRAGSAGPVPGRQRDAQLGAKALCGFQRDGERGRRLLPDANGLFPQRDDIRLGFRPGGPAVVGPDMAQLPAAGVVAPGEQHQRVAEQVFAGDVLLEEQHPVHFIARVGDRQLDGERHFAAGGDLRRVQEHGEQRRRARVADQVAVPVEQFRIAPPHRAFLPLGARGQVEGVGAARGDGGLDVVGRFDLLAGLARALDLGREGQRLDVQPAGGAQVPEHEAHQVLVALLGIDDAEVAAVAAVDEGARAPRDVGVLDPHQRRLEHELHDAAVLRLPDLGGAGLEAHVRRRGCLGDLVLGHRVAADVDDGVERPLDPGHGAPPQNADPSVGRVRWAGDEKVSGMVPARCALR